MITASQENVWIWIKKVNLFFPDNIYYVKTDFKIKANFS